MKELHIKIFELRDLGYSYKQIANELSCSKSTVAYHLGDGQKQKAKNRVYKRRSLSHPYLRKLEFFLSGKKNNYKFKNNQTVKALLQTKVYSFFQKDYKAIMFSVDDVINKFGEKPKCYITGIDIDIYQPKTYHFDHILPISRGGANTLDNLGLCTREANMAKSAMTYEELVVFCKQVVDYNNEKPPEQNLNLQPAN